MKTTTRMNAFALLAVAAIALGVTNWDRDVDPAQPLSSFAAAAAVSPSFTATADTGWLPAAQARQRIEAIGTALERLALERNLGVKVLDSAAQLRTRTAEGVRLAAPLARFERSFEFRARDAGDLEALRDALATLSVEVEPAPMVRGADDSSRRNLAQF